MPVWQTIKTMLSPGKYQRAMVGTYPGSALLQHHPRPFDNTLAVRHFSSWAYAAAMLNAQAVASVPLRLYVRNKRATRLFNTAPVPRCRGAYLRGDGDDGLRPSRSVLQKTSRWGDEFEVVADSHPILDLLATVNPHCNGFELTVLRMLYLQFTGNCYVHPVMDETLGRPRELWLMPSQWTTITPGKEQFIDGYHYGPNPLSRQPFASNEVIHWKLPNLDDMYYGRGCLEAVWSAMGLHDAKRRMDQARFDNHARPDYLLIVKQGVSGEALDRFEKQVDAKLRGVHQSGKFITVTGDVEAKPLNLPPEIIGDPDRIVEEIAAGFGVPVSKLLANSPNRANAQVGDAAWMRDTILPYCRLDEEKLNEKLLPLFGLEEDAVLAYDNPVPENRQFTLAKHAAYVKAGIMTRNEVRSELGMPPID